MVNPQYFCGLGLPKTGTTWLADYLRDNPDIYLPPVKELQVFNRIFLPELYEWMNPHFAKILTKRIADLQATKIKSPELVALLAEMLTIAYLTDPPAQLKAYRRLFRGRMTNQHLAFGEFSTTYALLPPQGLNLLKAAFASPKFIFVLRDPVNRYWSHVKHELRYKKDFDPIAYAKDDNRSSELSRMANYAEILPRLIKTLGEENIHILFYESLFVENDADALRQLTNFLGVDFKTPNFDKVIYAGADIDLPEDLADFLEDKFKPQYDFLKTHFSNLPQAIRLS